MMMQNEYYYGSTTAILTASSGTELRISRVRNWWPVLVEIDHTEYCEFEVPQLAVPKWWRWYDIFRTWAKPALLQLLDGARRFIRRVQERYPVPQRRKQKRRAYVQRLHVA